MKTMLYKQCYLIQNGIDENCDTPWETVGLIELKDLKPIITLIQYKVKRDFKVITIYPQIIKVKVINKQKENKA